MVTKKHFHFSSCDGVHKIHGILWKPEDEKIIGFLQIVHGMVEYIDRYDTFARFMCAHGFAVAGEDHLGHGLSVNSNDELGIFAKKNIWSGNLKVFRILFWGTAWVHLLRGCL